MMKILEIQYVLKGTKKDVELVEKQILDITRDETVVGLHIESPTESVENYIRGLK